MMMSTSKEKRSISFNSGMRSPRTPSMQKSNGIRLRRSLETLNFIPSPGVGQSRRHSTSNKSVIPQSPKFNAPFLPPLTPKSKHLEPFLSPALSLNLMSPPENETYKDDKMPIRDISNNLRTRLNYAFVKLRNGWQNKTLVELEAEPGRSICKSLKDTYTCKRDRDCEYQANLGFSNDKSEVGEDIDGIGGCYEINNGNEADDDSNNEADGTNETDDDSETSAQAAFLKVIQNPKKIHKSFYHRPSLKPSLLQIRSQPSEVEAIETLVSLSSLKKRSLSASFEYKFSQPPVSALSCANLSSLNSSLSSVISSKNALIHPLSLQQFPKFPIRIHSEVLTDVETDTDVRYSSEDIQ